MLALALAFLFVLNHPIGDEGASLRDILRYARDGVTIPTLRDHVNPAGPYAYALIGVIGQALGGTLRAFRLVPWINAAALLLLLYLWKRGAPSAAGGLVVLLANPYLPLVSATLLTEMPSLLALTLGLFLWLPAMPEAVTARRAMQMAAGGLLIGLSITGRQYFIAALPAMGLAFLWVTWRRRRRPPPAAWFILMLSIAIAILPLASLSLLWGSVTSPGMQNAHSYDSVHADIGLNVLRPLTALLYAGTMAAFPLALQPRASRRMLVLAGAAAATAFIVAVTVRGDDLWCPDPSEFHSCGPISQAVRAAAHHGRVAELGTSWLAGSLGLFGILLLADTAVAQRQVLHANTPAIFSLLFIVMFVIEQASVGGNIAFYERYVLQVSPFIGMLAAADGRFSTSRALLGSIPLLIMGQARLWRF